MLHHINNESAVWDSAAVRVAIYFAVAFFSTVLTQSEGITSWGEWTSLQWLRVVLASLVSGLVAVRAFLDQTLSKTDTEAGSQKPEASQPN